MVKWPEVSVGVPVTLTEPRTLLPGAATISKPMANAAPPLETRSWLAPRMPTRASTSHPPACASAASLRATSEATSSLASTVYEYVELPSVSDHVSPVFGSPLNEMSAAVHWIVET